jgi:dTDP-4-amino-4,6-dideoxygalactose transaminase
MSKLGINGGEPTRREPFPSWPVWDEREERELVEVLRSGIWGSFNQADSKVQQFENEFARSHSARYGRCVTNGSAALEVALRAVGIEYGDEVIVPPYTFVATANACLVVGAFPLFADINPETYNIDPAEIEKAITAKTKAIIPVHIGGCPADMDSILAIAERHSLWVIEDACQAHAASWDGRRVGSMGDLGCFSFQSSKNINAGEGGIILTSDEQLAERCWSIRSYGRIQGRGWYQHEILGDNYRMTEWQAAILLAQLTRLEELAQRREENALYLSEGLDQIEGVEPQRRDRKVTEHAYHLFILRYGAEAFGGLPREVFLSALRAEGIPCAAGYTPLYQAGAIQEEVMRLQRLVTGEEKEYSLPDCPVTERACNEEAVWLTQNMLLGTKKDIDDIVDAITKIKENVDTIRV